MRFLHLIWRNLLRHKRRNLLTVISIAASLFLFSALASLADIPDLILRGNANSLRLVCHNRAGLAFALPDAYARKIAAMPHVRAVQGWNWFAGTYRDAKDQFPNYAVDADTIAELWPEWGITPQAAADFRRVRNAALVGPEVAARYHWKIGDEITLRRADPPLDANLHIVGMLHGSRTSTGSLNLVVFNREYLESLQGRTGMVAIFWVQADSLKSIPAVIQEIDSAFANSDYRTQTEAEGVFTSELFASLGVFFTIAKALALLIAIAIMLVAANTSAMSIRERTTEISVMRAIGFNPGMIVVSLAAESLAIAIAGGILGCAATFAVMGGLAPPLPGLNTRVPLSTEAIAATLALSIVIGVLSAAVPASAAARRTIVEGLRHLV
jgi:putative ABC transport system permease protein